VGGQGAEREGRERAGARDAARIILSTAPDLEAATRIARALVESSAVACVNLLPGVRSVYRWQGQVEESGEVLMILKTTAGRVAEIEASWPAWHPYDLPEFVVLDPSHVEAKYLAWLVGESSGSVHPPPGPSRA
jgi:periplasmic divalent cation tolerance protein